MHDRSCEVTEGVVVAEIASAVARVNDSLHDLCWLPWIGRSYGHIGIFGDKRVLILGESHYEWCPECWSTKAPRPSSLTCRCVAERMILDDSSTIQHWKNIEYALTGGRLSEPQRREFWNSVAYYNFVQTIVGEYAGGPKRPRPSPQMYASSSEAFLRVLESLTPDVVIVLGFTLWPRLPDDGPNGKLSVLIKDGKELQRCQYLLSTGKQVLACRVRHPSAGLGRPWFPVIEKAIGVAEAPSR